MYRYVLTIVSFRASFCFLHEKDRIDEHFSWFHEPHDLMICMKKSCILVERALYRRDGTVQQHYGEQAFEYGRWRLRTLLGIPITVQNRSLSLIAQRSKPLWSSEISGFEESMIKPPVIDAGRQKPTLADHQIYVHTISLLICLQTNTMICPCLPQEVSPPVRLRAT